MPRKLPPFVERWRDRHGKMRHYFPEEKVLAFRFLVQRRQSLRPPIKPL